MSIKVMSRVWEKSAQKGSSLLLLLAIADFANDDGITAFPPSLATLAGKIRMSTRNSIRLVNILCQSGELYRLIIGAPSQPTIYLVSCGLTSEQVAAIVKSSDKLSGGGSDNLSLFRPVNSDTAMSLFRPVNSDTAMSHDPMKDHDHDDAAETSSDPVIVKALTAFGVDRVMAEKLACTCNLEQVEGWIAYAEERRHKLNSPVALVVARLKAGQEPPQQKQPANDRRRFIEGVYAEFVEH